MGLDITSQRTSSADWGQLINLLMSLDENAVGTNADSPLPFASSTSNNQNNYNLLFADNPTQTTHASKKKNKYTDIFKGQNSFPQSRSNSSRNSRQQHSQHTASSSHYASGHNHSLPRGTSSRKQKAASASNTSFNGKIGKFGQLYDGCCWALAAAGALGYDNVGAASSWGREQFAKLNFKGKDGHTYTNIPGSRRSFRARTGGSHVGGDKDMQALMNAYGQVRSISGGGDPAQALHDFTGLKAYSVPMGSAKAAKILKEMRENPNSIIACAHTASGGDGSYVMGHAYSLIKRINPKTGKAQLGAMNPWRGGTFLAASDAKLRRGFGTLCYVRVPKEKQKEFQGGMIAKNDSNRSNQGLARSNNNGLSADQVTQNIVKFLHGNRNSGGSDSLASDTASGRNKLSPSHNQQASHHKKKSNNNQNQQATA